MVIKIFELNPREAQVQCKSKRNIGIIKNEHELNGIKIQQGGKIKKFI